jgi:hypothetical protein
LGGKMASGDLLAKWREDIVGEWQAEFAGTDLLYLQPVAGRYCMRLAFRADKTADFKFSLPNAPTPAPTSSGPFPITWTLADDRVLSIWLPVPPMPDPDCKEPDWTREEVCYDVLAVTGPSLTISNRRFDGEEIIVLRRVNDQEYRKRQSQRAKEALDELRGLVGLPPLKLPSESLEGPTLSN